MFLLGLIFLYIPTTLGGGDTDSMIQQYVVDFFEGDEQAGFDYLNDKEAQGSVTIIEKLDGLGDAILETTEAEAAGLRNLSFVAAVDENIELSVLGWVDEEQFQPVVDGAIRGRKLSETEPYGIGMVKVDLLPNKPDGNGWKKVCVIDTGYENTHEDLPVVAAADGYSPYDSNQKWDEDLQGHGTHCAGTIGAIGGNNVGVNSVMNTNGSGFSNFFIAKGLRNNGSGTSMGVIDSMNECKAKGADVVSMSLGSFTYQQSYKDAVQSLWDAGILVVAAAGNAGNGRKSYPASYDHVISVAAVDSSKNRASFSQYNDHVEISGPGRFVQSTYKGNTYRSLSGTSMAAPHVAGVAALVWTHFPDCKPMQIRYALAKTADTNNRGRCNTYYGHGIVDAKAAYDFLQANPCTGDSWPPEFNENTYVRYGCNVLGNTSPPSSPPSRPITRPPSSPPTAAPLEGCESWCAIISVPWKAASSGGIAKCSWPDYCDKCAECTCKRWCSDIPESDIPWNATRTGGLSKCGTFAAFCTACDEC